MTGAIIVAAVLAFAIGFELGARWAERKSRAQLERH